MITSNENYNELLYVIEDPNSLSSTYYRIPADEPIYKIDLNKRTIEAPEFISVLADHNAEVVWFKVDRFYDDVDLLGCTCYIQYVNALNEKFITLTVPQVIQESNHDVLYIPWPIGEAVTRKSGNVQYSFQFFKLSEDKKRIFYSIHTQAATSKVLSTLYVDPLEDTENKIAADPYYSDLKQMFLQLSEDYSKLAQDYNVYWLEG